MQTCTIKMLIVRINFRYETRYLIVPIQLIEELHLEDAITISYTNGVEVWLEEDLDAILFIKAYFKNLEYGYDYATYTEWQELKTDYLESYSLMYGKAIS